ncbi:MAG: TetR/AcrR family transcriptional regulator [Clostridiaceae bacterium]|jgi:AcrR family transcriptional regulator|nr:TetR/AcrR family transcriptional regulator [Clostridiaceae bacterium]
MGKDPNKNIKMRQESINRILDSALSVYLRCGYTAADMNEIAKNANIAKGLMYYYFKSKQELFKTLFKTMFKNAMDLSEKALIESEDMPPVEKLAYFIYVIFGESSKNPQLIRFFMRFPFDTYAVFGPDNWHEAAQDSDLFRKSICEIIEKGIEKNDIPYTNADNAAHSFWTVFVANLFRYSKMMEGKEQDEISSIQNVASFCFRGLMIPDEVWQKALKNIVPRKEHNND